MPGSNFSSSQKSSADKKVKVAGLSNQHYIYISLYHTKSTMVGPVFWSLVDRPGVVDFSSPRW